MALSELSSAPASLVRPMPDFDKEVEGLTHNFVSQLQNLASKAKAKSLTEEEIMRARDDLERIRPSWQEAERRFQGWVEKAEHFLDQLEGGLHTPLPGIPKEINVSVSAGYMGRAEYGYRPPLRPPEAPPRRRLYSH